MPDCPNCGTWNPDDKIVCWRCQTELPKPVEKKKRKQRRIAGVPVWTWIVIALFFVFWLFAQSFLFSGGVVGP